ncbi:hypothetical protein [Aquibacillus rhizosphaerae]|uniref:Uncharacterized protein n=1 Tax=Aquibacillus rhizosphaerae TaxID=3051431 RepID=A0ABT7L6Z0_9BACI|nr:hypothetical protein [Aquibacillus sp. LR5S19]MDL4840980.1 hypothetical protein [Aquibacillus sp. LR5S19]
MIRNLFLIVILVAIVGCSEQNDLSFEEVVKKERIEVGGVDGVNIIDLVANDEYGIAFHTTYKGSEENQSPPSLGYFEKIDNKWERVSGTTCEKEWQVLGGEGNATYCGIVPDGYERIFVNEEEANVFQINEKLKAWYLVTDNPEYSIKAVAKDGHEDNLRD